MKAALLLALLLNAVQCFLGYRLFRIVVGVGAFVGGAVVGYAYGYRLGDGETGVAVLVALVSGGIAAALVSVFESAVGKLLWGAWLGALCVVFLWGVFGAQAPFDLVVMLAILGALSTLYFPRHIIIVSTAILGAWSIVDLFIVLVSIEKGALLGVQLLFYFGVADEVTPPRLLQVFFILLISTVGVVVQYMYAPAGADAGATAIPSVSEPESSDGQLGVAVLRFRRAMLILVAVLVVTELLPLAYFDPSYGGGDRRLIWPVFRFDNAGNWEGLPELIARLPVLLLLCLWIGTNAPRTRRFSDRRRSWYRQTAILAVISIIGFMLVLVSGVWRTVYYAIAVGPEWGGLISELLVYPVATFGVFVATAFCLTAIGAAKWEDEISEDENRAMMEQMIDEL